MGYHGCKVVSGRKMNQSDTKAVRKLISEDTKELSDRLTALSLQLTELKASVKTKSKTEDLKNAGWVRARTIMLAFGAPAAIVSVVLTVLGLGATAFYQLMSHAVKDAEFHVNTTNKLGEIQKMLLERNLVDAAKAPNTKLGQKLAITALATAKTEGVNIPLDVVRDSGAKFVLASASDPGAWEAAVHFVSYQSNLLENNLPVPRAYRPLQGPLLWELTFVTGPSDHRSPTIYGAGPDVGKERAASISNVGTATKTGPSLMPEYIIIDGAGTQDSVILDGYKVKNVVFKNLTIHYSGGALDLQNVVFLNCQFNIQHSQNGESLAKNLLSSSLITFLVS